MRPESFSLAHKSEGLTVAPRVPVTRSEDHSVSHEPIGFGSLKGPRHAFRRTLDSLGAPLVAAQRASATRSEDPSVAQGPFRRPDKRAYGSPLGRYFIVCHLSERNEKGSR